MYNISAPFSITHAVMVAFLASVAATLLSGVIAPLPSFFFWLTFLAPMPIYIVGLAWHPLVAALAMIFMAFFVHVTEGVSSSMLVIGAFAAPCLWFVFLCEKILINKPTPQGYVNANQDNKNIILEYVKTNIKRVSSGDFLGFFASIGIIYLVVSGVFVMYWVEPDYTIMMGTFKKMIEEVIPRAQVQLFLSQVYPHETKSDEVINYFYDFVSVSFFPLSFFMIFLTHFISAGLGWILAERARNLPFLRPDFRRFRMPGGSLLWIIFVFWLMRRGEYPALMALSSLLPLLFCFLMQGLAVIHIRASVLSGGKFIVFTSWFLWIVFGFPAVIFIVIGLLDHLFNFRKQI